MSLRSHAGDDPAGDPATGSTAGSLLLAGTVLWLVSTPVVGVAGDRAFAAGRPLATAAVFVAAVPAVTVVAYALYSWFDVRDGDRPRAAALLVLPGLFLGAGAVVVADAAGLAGGATTAEFAALSLVASAVVLLTGFVPREVGDPEEATPRERPAAPAPEAGARSAADGPGTGSGPAPGDTGPRTTDGGTDR
jgi:hypothetical protein